MCEIFVFETLVSQLKFASTIPWIKTLHQLKHEAHEVKDQVRIHYEKRKIFYRTPLKVESMHCKNLKLMLPISDLYVS